MAKSKSSKNLLLQLDIFGRPLPTFNLNGNERVKTWPGVLLTILIFCSVLVIVCLLSFKLVNGANPIISERTETSVFPRDYRFDFG